MRLAILALAAISATLACWPCAAGAVSFQSPAELGDRRIELLWTPETDDPLYTGNLEIFPIGSRQLGGGEVTQLFLDRFGEQLWALDRHGSMVVRLEPLGNESWVPTDTLSPLPSGEILCAALHPAGILLAAGLADGRIAIWRPGQSLEPTILDAHTGPCRGIAFASATSERDSSFMSVGEDGLMIRWSYPGQVSVSQNIGQALTAVAMTAAGDEAAVGRADGEVGVWIVAGAFENLVEIHASDGHPVIQVVFSADGSRLATADDLGRVRVWNKRFGFLLGPGFNPSPARRARIAFTPRQSEFLAYALEDGTIGALGGTNGIRYDIQRSVGRPVTGFALSSDGRTSFLGGAGGQLDWWYQGGCEPGALTPECFGGYIVWRGTSLDPGALVRMRVYQYGDTTWPWTPLDTLRAFVDPDSIIPRAGDPEQQVAGPHNGVPYYYCLTKFYRKFFNGQSYEIFMGEPRDGCYRNEEGEQVPLIARRDAITAKPLLDGVYVVPNPYLADDPLSHFGSSGTPLVRFERLPEEATIRIFTVSGDLVRTLHHRQTPNGEVGGSCPWDLRNEEQRAVASGVYIYAVETPSGEQSSGFLTLVR